MLCAVSIGNGFPIKAVKADEPCQRTDPCAARRGGVSRMPQAAEWHGQAVLDSLLAEPVVQAARRDGLVDPGDERASLRRTACEVYADAAVGEAADGIVTEWCRLSRRRSAQSAHARSPGYVFDGAPGLRNPPECRPILPKRSGASTVVAHASRGTFRRFVANHPPVAAIGRCQGGQHGRR